tara:strand:- start:343 stop:528 length:186 start_codon:yes stop_codon:yes gene_type:complete
MATLKKFYSLEIDEKEARALKILLGNMTDPQFKQFGVEGEYRMIIREIWDLIPYDEDDNHE